MPEDFVHILQERENGVGQGGHTLLLVSKKAHGTLYIDDAVFTATSAAEGLYCAVAEKRMP